MTVNEKVLSAIQKLPDDIDFKDVSDEVALLAAVEEAERDISEGKTISNEEMRERIKGWGLK